MNKQKILLLLIILIGIFLRFYRLGDVPSSLNWDEVSWGYNAYSITQTGKDEHGASFPLSFQAFGDYKQPVYVYLAAVSVKLFDLNPFSVRLPSAVLGSATILFVYLLVAELFGKHPFSKNLALLSAFFFAISPWSIQFSRVAFEANVGLFFTIFGTWLILYGVRKPHTIVSVLGIVVLSISCYTYHSQKIFTPLLFLGILFYAYLTHNVKKTLIFTFLVIFLISNIFWLIDPNTTKRGRSVTFFSNPTQLITKPTEKIIYDAQHNDRFGMLLHNRRFVYAKKYLENYSLHFDLNFLFLTGDNPRHHPPKMGILYLSLLPAIIFGMYYFLSRKIYAGLLIGFWFLIAPISSALAVNAPNASRSLVFLPTYEIFAAAGIVFLFTFLKKLRIERVIKIVLFTVFAANVLYYVHMYLWHTDTDFGQYWQDGYRQAVLYVEQNRKVNTNVLFAKDMEQPYIFYLFYTKFDPQRYQSVPDKNKPCQRIDNTYFGSCEVTLQKNDMLVTYKKNPPADFVQKTTISYKNGTPALYIFEKL